MDKDKIFILESFGWEVECESPFELYHAETNSRATGLAAKIVLDCYIQETGA